MILKNQIQGRIMKKYLDDDFLLDSHWAQDLYFNFSQKMPILDYHCHLSAHDILQDRQFENLGEIWLESDHYKWRAMRTMGVDESFITGEASWKDKFQKWAETVPSTLRNPLYDWTHLELSRYFSVKDLLSEQTCESIYHSVSDMLRSKKYSARNLMKKMNLTHCCTTNDPVETLLSHKKLSDEDFSIKVLPTFRPDRFMDISQPQKFLKALDELREVVGQEIKSYTEFLDALKERHDYFHSLGCRLSDHGMTHIPLRKGNITPEKIFLMVCAGQPISQEQVHVFMVESLLNMCRLNQQRGWAQQFHLGVSRNTNKSQLNELGSDSGFDSMGDYTQGPGLMTLLDTLERDDKLAKTIIYNINPSDNALIATLIGCFQKRTPGKIQWGASWWFMDQKMGIKDHLNTLSTLSLLTPFVGMLTDSRSFLSYPRHEYFRRILCNTLGGEVERGELPADRTLLGNLVKRLSYGNAQNYFQFDD